MSNSAASLGKLVKEQNQSIYSSKSCILRLQHGSRYENERSENNIEFLAL